MPTEHEQALIERAKCDPRAFADLYELHVEALYTYLYRRVGDEQTAQDLTATTFEKALASLPRFRWTGVTIRAWLFRIARNEAVSHGRRRRLWTLLTLQHTSEINVEWVVEQAESSEQIHLALKRLSKADRELLTLRFFDGLESSEIAEVLGCSKENVYLRLHRALKRLGKEYEAIEERLKEGNPHGWQTKTAHV